MRAARQHLRNAVDLTDAGDQRLELGLTSPQPFGSVNQLSHRLGELAGFQRSDQHTSEHGDHRQPHNDPQQRKRLQEQWRLPVQPAAKSPEVVGSHPPHNDHQRKVQGHYGKQHGREGRPHQLTAHVLVQPRSARSKRKPTPRTVEMKRGWAASSPSFRRNTEMCMSSVLVDPNHTVSQISRISCSRETTLPCSRTRTRNRSNSLAVSWSSSSLKKARRASGSTRTTAPSA